MANVSAAAQIEKSIQGLLAKDNLLKYNTKGSYLILSNIFFVHYFYNTYKILVEMT